MAAVFYGPSLKDSVAWAFGEDCVKERIAIEDMDFKYVDWRLKVFVTAIFILFTLILIAVAFFPLQQNLRKREKKYKT